MRNPAPVSEPQKYVGVIRSSSGISSVAQRRFTAHADAITARFRDMTETFRRATKPFLKVCFFALLLSGLATPGLAEPADTASLHVEITWGHRSANVQPLYVKLAGSVLTIAAT